MKAQGIFIIPYFGKLPNYFPFWLQSCKGNPFFHWLLITDAEIDIPIPDNVFVRKTSFHNFVSEIQAHFDFKITLEKPYKICDFRPAYGIIFQKEISKYSYWGFCDIDLFWGDLTPLADVAKKNIYDKICDLGHCTLLKNTLQHATAFRAKYSGCLYYKDVFSSSRNMIFDEDGTNHDGFTSICTNLGMSVFPMRKSIADIQIRNFSLKKILYNSPVRSEKRFHEIYLIDKNSVIEIYKNRHGTICHENNLYVHFQKRKILIETSNTNHYLLIPPGRIIDIPENLEQKLLSLAPTDFRCLWWNFRVNFRRIPLRIKMFFFHYGRTFLDFSEKNMRSFYKIFANKK